MKRKVANIKWDASPSMSAKHRQQYAEPYAEIEILSRCSKMRKLIGAFKAKCRVCRNLKWHDAEFKITTLR